jgi:hypothetical protein
MDSVVIHDCDYLDKWRFFGDGDRSGSHDVRNLAAGLAESVSRLTG